MRFTVLLAVCFLAPAAWAQPLENLRGFDIKNDNRECVAYVRDRTGMKASGIGVDEPDSKHKAWKVGLINSKLNEPKRGDVAIIAESAAWHLAYVEEVGARYPQSYKKALGMPEACWITISETNFKRGKYQKRTAVGASCAAAWAKLKIRGFHRP